MRKTRWFFLLTLVFTSWINRCWAKDKKVSYLVPVKWNGRTDWQQAFLLTESVTKVTVQLKNNSQQQLQYTKQDVALDQQMKQDDIFIGMVVVVKMGVDDKRMPFYSEGTIVGQLRLAQYNVTLSCDTKVMPLGVGEGYTNSRVKKIKDHMMSASSAYNNQLRASRGRLGNNEVWCPSRRDARSSWLQVDLGLPYYICSVAVKGNTGSKNEWVQTYVLALSSDGTVFHHVKENSVIKEFQASRVGLESALDVDLPYRFVRFFPRRYHNYPCMGVEVYGVGPARTFQVGQQFNLNEIRLKGDPAAPYLLVPFDWNGRKDWRLARYVSHTADDVHVKMISGSHKTAIFNSNDVILNLPPRVDVLHPGTAVYAPFARDVQGMAMYAVGRINFVQNGEYLVTPICSKAQKSLPVGIGVASTFPQDRIKQIPDHKLSATSSHTNHEAKHGRLGNKKVWCASDNQLRTSRFQVDLGSLYFICSVAVQGNLQGEDGWVTSFKMAFSIDGRKWKFVASPDGSDIFQRSGRLASEFFLGLDTAYRYVSFNPISYNKRPCMGVELYGVGPIKGNQLFDVKTLRTHGSACQLQNKCPDRTQCKPGRFPGSYSCKCPDGYMSSAAGGGPTIKHGTDEHCRSINPTGKTIIVEVQKLPQRSRPANSRASSTAGVSCANLICSLAVMFILKPLHNKP